MKFHPYKGFSAICNEVCDNGMYLGWEIVFTLGWVTFRL